MIKFIIKDLFFKQYLLKNKNYSNKVEYTSLFDTEEEAWNYIIEKRLSYCTVIKIYLKK
jgi:hypothetical protein